MDPRITAISELPQQLRDSVSGLNDSQLDTPYREGGWTVRQVVHHIADSHMNAFIRMKLILTEEHPTLKPYEQDDWAIQADAKSFPVESSLAIVDGLHARMVEVLRNVKPDEWQRTAFHPENGEMKLEDLLNSYAKHGAGHVKQITDLRERMGW
jgi:hypothetical protein